MTTAQADPMIGRLVDGRYQVRSRIARGGMATVYLATDLRLERRVAIKIMHGHLADDNTFKTRFVQEARSAARLAHPNVVNVFDQGQDSDMAYLVMEYLPGITLRDLLKDYKRLTPEQTVDIMDAVLAGLAAAHRAGIVHRDVKPENVLLADDGRIKLGDFGLARAASQNTATGQALLGTIAYLSPELVTRGIADARSDVYAVGIMMYEMLTGEQPFVGEAPMQIAYQHANDQVPTPSSRNPGVPVELDELVLWATARAPEERPGDAGELLERLREAEPAIRAGDVATVRPTLVLADGLEPTPAETTAVLGPRRPDGAAGSESSEQVTRLTRSASRRRRRGYWILALVILLVGAAGGTGWYFGAGPGAFATVPDVSQLTPEAATMALEEQGFGVVQDERNDPVVPVGGVSGTEPGSGAEARKGSRVTLFVSLGPSILAVPDVIGHPEADARAQLSAFTVAEASAQQFSADVPNGGVIAVLDGSGNTVGPSYPERGALSLVVSVGPVPDLSGLAKADAEAKLAQADLVPAYNDAAFDDSGEVAADHVLDWGADTDPVRPGDTIWITLSKGQDLVDIPALVGTSMRDAIDQLDALGFDVSYQLPDILLPIATVASMSPEGGTQAVRGSTIVLVSSLTL